MITTQQSIIEPRQLRPYQLEAVKAVESDWDDGYRRVGVVLATGLGKDLSDDTEIPTFGGFKRMRDIRIGNYVFGPDGKPTRVMAVMPQGVVPLYRVEFDDGASVLTGAQHEWTVQRRGRIPRTVTTAWLMRQKMIDSNDGYFWRVPVMDGAQFIERGLSLNPYLTGALIANGHVVNERVPELITPDDKVIEIIRSRGIIVKDSTYTNDCPHYSFPGLSHAITRSCIRGNLSKHKSIPEPYKTASYADRLDLIRGLMDGDGSTRSGGRRSICYHTTSPLLADDICELIWSIGGRASVCKYDRSHDDKPVEYLVNILPPERVSLFGTQRKERNDHPRRTFRPRRSIVSITPAGSGPSTCITVEHPSGLFACTRRYILTHNSTVGGKLISNAYRDGQRVLVLAHRAELLDQFQRDTMAVDPSIPPDAFGHVRAARNDVDAPIVFATFQTLAHLKRRRAVGRRDVIIVDETHHLVATGYHATFRELGGYDSALMCGLTATMARAEPGKDDIGLGDVIEKISYERDLQWSIENGYLVKPTGLTVRIPDLNKLNSIPNVAGDFNQGQLARVMEAAVGYTVEAIERHAPDRQSIVFAASVNSAHMIARRLNSDLSEHLCDKRLTAVAITGEMPYEERLPYYKRFRTGKLDVLVTVGVLTEGADFPTCDCIVMARPTRSPLLYSQMVGRALRPLPGKDDALVLDLSGVTSTMKLISLTDLAVKDLIVIDVDINGEEIEPEPEPAEPKTQPERIVRDGVVDMVPVDLFGYSHVLWLRTPAGVSFMPLPESHITFLWPHDGDPDSSEYAAGWLSTRSGLGEFVDLDDDGKPVYRPMASAMAKATKWAEDAGHRLPVRKAGWRSGRNAPSEAQLRLAAGLNIPNAARMSRGRLSDEISICFASRWLDRRMRV